MLLPNPLSLPSERLPATATSTPAAPLGGRRARPGAVRSSAGADDDEEEDLGDEEDLAVAQPAADEDSVFDDFDDEFDDDFEEEEEDDPDWDHPDDGESEPPPGKAPGRKT